MAWLLVPRASTGVNTHPTFMAISPSEQHASSFSSKYEFSTLNLKGNEEIINPFSTRVSRSNLGQVTFRFYVSLSKTLNT
jgi:hypothetical protein